MSASFAGVYDWTMGRAERGRLSRWRDEVVGAAQGDVLEIAAGTGLNFPYYRAGTAVIATEPDPDMIERARPRAANAAARIVIVRADAQVLPFADATFDTVVVALGLCTIPSLESALAELRRVLKRGGVARLLEHVRGEGRIVGLLQDLLTPSWRRIAGGCRLNQRTVEIIRHAGFRIDETHVHARGLVVGIKASIP